MVSDRVRAYHEAAHAVVAIVMGIPIEQTTILYTNDENGRKIYGYTKYKDLTDASHEEQAGVISDTVIVALAPIYTVDKIGEGELATLGCLIDYERANTIIASFTEENDREKLLTKAKHKANKEVKRNWEYIRAVAEELLVKKTLTGKEVYEIMTRV